MGTLQFSIMQKAMDLVHIWHTEWEIHIGGEFFVICHCVEGNE